MKPVFSTLLKVKIFQGAVQLTSAISGGVFYTRVLFVFNLFLKKDFFLLLIYLFSEASEEKKEKKGRERNKKREKMNYC